MVEALIYRPGKNAMQSGRAATAHWLLEIKPETPQSADPLMGWVGSNNTLGQIRLGFDSKEEAVRHAVRHGMTYEAIDPKTRKNLPKSYSDNFRHDRPDI